MGWSSSSNLKFVGSFKLFHLDLYKKNAFKVAINVTFFHLSEGSIVSLTYNTKEKVKWDISLYDYKLKITWTKEPFYDFLNETSLNPVWAVSEMGIDKNVLNKLFTIGTAHLMNWCIWYSNIRSIKFCCFKT